MSAKGRFCWGFRSLSAGSTPAASTNTSRSLARDPTPPPALGSADRPRPSACPSLPSRSRGARLLPRSPRETPRTAKRKQT
jgi:hypothetical protein